MFIRKKKNPSGIISIQIIDKGSGRYKLVKTIGNSSNNLEIEKYCWEGDAWIRNKLGQLELDFSNELQRTKELLDGIEQITVSGTEFLLGKIFNEIGFNKIKDDLFRRLVLARLCYPASKLKTTDYLSKYHFLEIGVQQIYVTSISCIKRTNRLYSKSAISIHYRF